MDGELKIERGVALGPLTTLGVGGAAAYFVRAASEDEVEAVFGLAAAEGLPVFVLGGGSNIVVSDAGFDGLVVQIALKGLEFEEIDGDVVRLSAAAGEDWDRVVEECVARELAGFECLSGIPGLVGGTPVQNVGAYGQEVSETIVSVRCFDRTEKKFVELTNKECGFAYRTSIFNTTERDRYVVLSVKFDLNRGGNPRLSYKDLKERFAEHVPTLAEIREAVLDIRRQKSMVIDSADPNSRSAGSFFKNPIINANDAGELANLAGEESVPSFPAGEGRVKVPAAWLIEHAGYRKGYRLGQAGISANHSLAIVNFGGATSMEVILLKDEIQTAVEAMFGISLQPEPIFVGF